jgi:hypothetical protein
MTRLVMEAVMLIAIVTLLWFMMKIGSVQEDEAPPEEKVEPNDEQQP